MQRLSRLAAAPLSRNPEWAALMQRRSIALSRKLPGAARVWTSGSMMLQMPSVGKTPPRASGHPTMALTMRRRNRGQTRSLFVSLLVHTRRSRNFPMHMYLLSSSYHHLIIRDVFLEETLVPSSRLLALRF